jgi:hypothetical protein
VGLEEGSNGTIEEIQRRLLAWQALGCQELEDACEFHEHIGASRLFGARAKLQTTWGQLCRIVLASKGQPTDAESVRLYQGLRLGRRHEETCLLELLPLPSKAIGEWIYTEVSGLTQLADRKSAQRYYAPRRVAHIHQQIREYSPQVVVFYSLGHRRWWSQIAGLSFERTEPQGWYQGISRNTLFLVTRHPAAHGVTNAYFESVGQMIREWNNSRNWMPR